MNRTHHESHETLHAAIALIACLASACSAAVDGIDPEIVETQHALARGDLGEVSSSGTTADRTRAGALPTEKRVTSAMVARVPRGSRYVLDLSLGGTLYSVDANVDPARVLVRGAQDEIVLASGFATASFGGTPVLVGEASDLVAVDFGMSGPSNDVVFSSGCKGDLCGCTGESCFDLVAQYPNGTLLCGEVGMDDPELGLEKGKEGCLLYPNEDEGAGD